MPQRCPFAVGVADKPGASDWIDVAPAPPMTKRHRARSSGARHGPTCNRTAMCAGGKGGVIPSERNAQKRTVKTLFGTAIK